MTPRFRRISGVALMVVGVAVAANAAIAGPRAFASGVTAAVAMVAVRLAVASAGAWWLVRIHGPGYGKPLRRRKVRCEVRSVPR